MLIRAITVKKLKFPKLILSTITHLITFAKTFIYVANDFSISPSLSSTPMRGTQSIWSAPKPIMEKPK